jgi:very-short-patch-repair endonuclease
MSDTLTQLAEHQHGAISMTQARDLGFSARALDELQHTRSWERATAEVLRRVGTPRGRGQKVMIATLDAGPDAVLSHRSCASWWGVRGPRVEPIHVCRTSRSHRRSEVDAVIHTVRELPTTWVTVLDGVPVARPELVALQLFASCREAQAERWVEAMWSLRLLDGRSLIRFVAQMGARGRNGTAGLRRYLEPRGPGYLPAASGVESRTQQILRNAGIEVRRQVDLGDEVHWTGRVDFLVVGAPVVIEVQSERHHDALVDRDSDTARLAALRRAGFAVVEVTDTEVWSDPTVVVERVRAALRAAT